MQSRILQDQAQKTYAVVLETGDDVMPTLLRFARDHRLSGSHFTAIGAFRNAVLGYFEWDRKDYKRIPVDEQVEVVALIGDIALDENGEPALHAHVVLGREDGTALGGHLLDAIVRPTLEVIVTESPAHLCRRHDPSTGLALIRP